MKNNYKGVVLAAGFGSRLRPLSEKTPKPLVNFLDTCALEYNLFALKNLGIEQLGVNAHYLASQVQSFIEKRPFDLDIFYSFEKELLGTGGCYNGFRDWLGDDHLIVLNGDVIADFNLEAWIEDFEQNGQGALASLVCLKNVVAGENGLNRETNSGNITGLKLPLREGETYVNFACAQVLTPEIFEIMPKSGAFGIFESVYVPLFSDAKKIHSYLHEGFWHDLRNASMLHQAGVEIMAKLCHEPDFAKNNWPTNLKDYDLLHRQSKRPSLVHAGVANKDLGQIGEGVFLGKGVSLAGKLSVENCIAFGDSRIDADQKNCLVSDGLCIQV